MFLFLFQTVSRVITASIANPIVAVTLRILYLVIRWMEVVLVRRDGKEQLAQPTQTSVLTPPFVLSTLTVPTRQGPTRVIALPDILLPEDSVSVSLHALLFFECWKTRKKNPIADSFLWPKAAGYQYIFEKILAKNVINPKLMYIIKNNNGHKWQISKKQFKD